MPSRLPAWHGSRSGSGKIDGHALHGSGRRIVERKVSQFAARFADAAGPYFVGYSIRLVTHFPIRLPHPDSEGVFAVLPVIHIAEIGLDFARKEKLVGGRQESQGAAIRLQNAQAVSRTQAHRFPIDRSTKSILLPRPRRVPPDDAATVGDRKPLQPANILISHRGLAGLGDGLLPQQVGAAVHGVLERAGENTRVQTREAHLQPRAHGLHPAARRLVFGPYLANLLRLPGQIQVGSRAAGNHQWRVPERVPLFPLHHARRKFDMQLFQRANLLLREPSDAAGDFEFGGQILSEYDPVPAAFARGQFAHYRLPATNRKLGAQLFSALPLPTDFQNAGANLSL